MIHYPLLSLKYMGCEKSAICHKSTCTNIMMPCVVAKMTLGGILATTNLFVTVTFEKCQHISKKQLPTSESLTHKRNNDLRQFLMIIP